MQVILNLMHYLAKFLWETIPIQCFLFSLIALISTIGNDHINAFWIMITLFISVEISFMTKKMILWFFEEFLR